MLAQHGFTREAFDALDMDPPRECAIKYADKDDCKLVVQILCTVLNSRRIQTGSSPAVRTTLFVNLTPRQHAEVTFMLSVFREAWKRAKEDFTTAFFHKHALHPTAVDDGDGDGEPPTLDLARVMRIASMLDGMEHVAKHRQLSPGARA